MPRRITPNIRRFYHAPRTPAHRNIRPAAGVSPCMKLALAAVAAILACTAGAAEPPTTPPAAPVVVELFTSEGCSSCPPADAALLELATRGDVLALEFHVDYWDYLGWRDPFSSAEHTARQEAYSRTLTDSRVYTPQMVVGGTDSFIGTSRSAARRAISRAAAAQTSGVEVSLAARRDDRVELAISVTAVAADSEVMLAITESGLATAVPRGENAGRTLAHAPVVRRLVRLGRARPGAAWTDTTTLIIDPAWSRDRVAAVVFVQEHESRAIVGAAAIDRV
jgi:hypothetical protein